MIYLIYGVQNVMINNRIKKIVKERLPFTDALNYVNFDLDNATLEEALNEASYLPLGYDNKLVVIKNCYFLKSQTRGKNKNDSTKDSALLYRYLKKDNRECDLILVYPDVDLNLNSDLFKLIQEKGKIFKLTVEKNDWYPYVYRYFTESLKIKIDRDAIEELIVRVKGDLNIFVNEAQKLALLTDHVRYEDVVNIVSRPLEDNLFNLFNYLMNNDSTSALKLLDDLYFDGVEPVNLISMLANQFRVLLEIIYLCTKKMSNTEIATELKINEVRVKILKRYLYTMSLSSLMNTLDELYWIDYKIKSGQVDRFIAFKMFVINFKTK